VVVVASPEPDAYPAASKAAQVGFLKTRGVKISSFRGSRREGSSQIQGFMRTSASAQQIIHSPLLNV